MQNGTKYANVPDMISRSDFTNGGTVRLK
jgi:hypothetical protein